MTSNINDTRVVHQKINAYATRVDTKINGHEDKRS